MVTLSVHEWGPGKREIKNMEWNIKGPQEGKGGTQKEMTWSLLTRNLVIFQASNWGGIVVSCSHGVQKHEQLSMPMMSKQKEHMNNNNNGIAS